MPTRPKARRTAPKFPLQGLRESAGMTQAEVARASGLAQPDVSRLETAETLDDRQISTLRRYLTAIGAQLEIAAVSKDGHRIEIVSPGAPGALAPVSTESDKFAWMFDASQVEKVAKAAVTQLAVLADDPNRDTAALAVASEAIEALKGDEHAAGNVEWMHEGLVGDRDVQVGQIVEMVVEWKKQERWADAPASGLLANGLERFDAAYRKLAEDPIRHQVDEIVRCAVPSGQRPKKGQHTIGATVQLLQELAGARRAAPRDKKTQREAIDDGLRKLRKAETTSA